MNTPILVGGTAVAVPPPDIRLAKQSMRERIRAERQRRTAREREMVARGLTAVALEIPEIISARRVALYASTPSAPGTGPLRRALRAGGVQVLLPVLLDDGQMDWRSDGDPAHPAPADGIYSADAIIVPALAVDTLGHRLGQGTGFYDRALQRLGPTVTVFAFVHESEVLDAAVEAVPVESHDWPVDAVVTPNRCLRLGGPHGSVI